MKFISKSSNLLVVLRAGLSAQPITGTPARPTISVRFKDGVAEVQQEDLIELMLAHPAFNSDFISADDVAGDPYVSLRKSSEPDHVRTEIQFGTPVRREVNEQKKTLPPEIQKMIQEAASEMAKQMLPGMVESTLKSILKDKGGSSAPSTPKKAKGKPGRKAKAQVVKEEVFPPVDSESQEEINLSE